MHLIEPPGEGRRAFARTFLFFGRKLFAPIFGAACALAAVAAEAGVRLLEPGEDMAPIEAFKASRPGAPGSERALKMPAARVAATGGDAEVFARLIPHAAPFEIVAPSADPDLVFDPSGRLVRAGREIFARDVAVAELPEVIDRFAFGAALARGELRPPLPLRVLGPAGPRRQGETVDVEAQDVAGRALVVFSVAGDGLVRTLYPLADDPPVLAASPFRLSFAARAPFGEELVVAVSTPAPAGALEQGLRELNGRRAAGQLAQLLAVAAPADARIGAVAFFMEP